MPVDAAAKFDILPTGGYERLLFHALCKERTKFAQHGATQNVARSPVAERGSRFILVVAVALQSVRYARQACVSLMLQSGAELRLRRFWCHSDAVMRFCHPLRWADLLTGVEGPPSNMCCPRYNGISGSSCGESNWNEWRFDTTGLEYGQHSRSRRHSSVQHTVSKQPVT